MLRCIIRSTRKSKAFSLHKHGIQSTSIRFLFKERTHLYPAVTNTKGILHSIEYSTIFESNIIIAFSELHLFNQDNLRNVPCQIER